MMHEVVGSHRRAQNAQELGHPVGKSAAALSSASASRSIISRVMRGFSILVFP